jgi:hypothetical protein
MAKIMAYENQEEWGTNAKVEMETIRSTLRALAEGRIELPLTSKQAGNIRFALISPATKSPERSGDFIHSRFSLNSPANRESLRVFFMRWRLRMS